MKKLFALIVIGAMGLAFSHAGSRNTTAQTGKATYKGNNCVDCHSKIDLPISVSARYYEWQFSRHQERGVSCDKCHGGDPKATDKDQAHVGVLRSTEAKSRLNRNNQAVTCSACHQQVVDAFVQSAHYRKLQKAGLGPSCNTCHGHMATRVIHTPKDAANLCSSCHNATDLMPPRPEIASGATETMMGLQRADGVINWATLLLAEGARLGLHLTDEQKEFEIARQLLSEAKTNWHSFNLEETQRTADNAFRRGTKVKDELRKKITAD